MTHSEPSDKDVSAFHEPTTPKGTRPKHHMHDVLVDLLGAALDFNELKNWLMDHHAETIWTCFEKLTSDIGLCGCSIALPLPPNLSTGDSLEVSLVNVNSGHGTKGEAVEEVNALWDPKNVDGAAHRTMIALAFSVEETFCTSKTQMVLSQATNCTLDTPKPFGVHCKKWDSG